MTSSRRGFFATLAALPAVVMGRKAIATEHSDRWPRRVPVHGAIFVTDPATGQRIVYRFGVGR